MKTQNNKIMEKYPDWRLVETDMNQSSFYCCINNNHYLVTVINGEHINKNIDIDMINLKNDKKKEFEKIVIFLKNNSIFIMDLKELNKYRDLIENKYSILGMGGSSVVFKTPQNTILKILKAKDEKKRFEDEKIFLMKLKNISGVIKIIADDPVVQKTKHQDLMTLELGENSLNFMNSLGIFEKIKYFVGLIETLEEIHNEKIYHLDIKPENIVFHENKLKFIDFGISYFKNYSEKNMTSRNFHNLGAKFTISPEMKRNPFYEVSEKADIYSLSKTLWIYLTGEKKCFEGEYSRYSRKFGLKYVKNKNLNKQVLVQTEYSIHYRNLEEMLTKCTNENPHRRPSLKEMKVFLKDFLKAEDKFLNNTEEYKKEAFLEILRNLVEKYPPNISHYEIFNKKEICECEIEEDLEPEVHFKYLEWNNKNIISDIKHELICSLIRYKMNVKIINKKTMCEKTIDNETPENISEKIGDAGFIIFNENSFKINDYIIK